MQHARVLTYKELIPYRIYYASIDIDLNDIAILEHSYVDLLILQHG